MAAPQTVAVYTDYKSPYAYLAKDLVYELERNFPVRVDWLPYRLDIPSFSAPRSSTIPVASSKNNATLINGAGCATVTWTAAATRASAD